MPGEDKLVNSSLKNEYTFEFTQSYFEKKHHVAYKKLEANNPSDHVNSDLSKKMQV